METENPMSGIPNLEELEKDMSKMTADQELAMIKAPYYQAKAMRDQANANFELVAEQTINQVYKHLIEKNAVVKALQSELAKSKKPEEPQN